MRHRAKTELVLTPAFFAAMAASGRPRHELITAVASALGYTTRTVENMLAPGHRLPASSGPRLAAVICGLINFPVEHAFGAASPAETSGDPRIERQFQAARARIRAERRRLSIEDCFAQKESPYGIPGDTEAA